MFDKKNLTGIKRKWRRCPIHKEELELYLDDFKSPQPNIYDYNWEMNRIQWLCDKCGRFYSETSFIESQQREIFNNYVVPLRLTCPSCGSTRIAHSCDPDCCDEHQCYNCNTRFNLTTIPVDSSRTNSVINKVHELRMNSLLFSKIDAISKKYELEKTGLVKWWRKCPNHRSIKMELCFLNGPIAEDSRLVWFCKKCNGIYTENTLRGRYWLVLDVLVPLPKCKVCNSIDHINIEGDNKKIQCKNCQSLLEVEYSILN